MKKLSISLLLGFCMLGMTSTVQAQKSKDVTEEIQDCNRDMPGLQ